MVPQPIEIAQNGLGAFEAGDGRRGNGEMKEGAKSLKTNNL
jgi:hypothetical protein